MLIDTLSLVSSYLEKCEIAPINTGSTIRKPARRGLETFTRIADVDYSDWQKKRGGKDRIKEVVVAGSITDITKHIIEIKSMKDFA